MTGLMVALAALSAAASVRLDIPPRRQWDNRNGYCGECCVQQAALFYGAYVSQYRVRAIVDPTQAQDVWIPEHARRVFAALRLTYVRWNSDQAQPQYKAHLVWIVIGQLPGVDKRLLNGRRPTGRFFKDAAGVKP